MFKSKTMTQDEWAIFEIACAPVIMNKRGPDYALFRESGSLTEPARILIVAPDPEILEVFSPGGWTDCDDAAESKWQLLIGDANAFATFGLTHGL